MTVYRELLRHSLVYGAGRIVAALAALVLLPLYTRALTPADYGVIALLDVTLAVATSLVLTALGTGATRLQHDPAWRDEPHRVWTSAFAALLACALPAALAGLALRRPLATALLGAEVEDGGLYLGLLFLTLPLHLTAQLGFAYLSARKRSGLLLGVQLPGMALRIALAVWWIVGLDAGVLGYLYASLAATAVEAAVLAGGIFWRRPFAIETRLLRELGRFGWPLAVSGLASLAMHDADRYLLKALSGDLAAVGVYSLAYNLVQGVNGMLLTPFFLIWSTSLYEIAARADRGETFARVFRAVSLLVALVLVAVALGARPLLRLLAAPAFYGAADLVPPLCLGFLCFTLHLFFSAPALLQGRSGAITVTALVAVGTNVALNLALIPSLGAYGAALASLATYAVYAFFGHWRYRRLEDLGFPLRVLALPVGLGTLLVIGQRALLPAGAGWAAEVATAVVAWTLVVVATLLGPGRPLVAALARRSSER